MRQVILWTIALTILFYCTSHARSDDYSIKFGPGIRDSKLTGSTKAFGLRRESSLGSGLHLGLEGGGYVDNGGHGRSSSFIAKAQVGVMPGMEAGIFGKAFVGPCLISATDSQLGGHGQICADTGIGIRDKETFMDISYGHISSAGLALPNQGRDYLSFECGLRW